MPRHPTLRPLRWVSGLLLPLLLITTGCDSASGSADAAEEDGDKSKKKKKKKKKEKKRKKRDADRTSLTDEEIKAACKRIVDKKLDKTYANQKSCEAGLRRAWDRPNEADALDDVKIAVGRHDCAMDASSRSSFDSCMREVFDAAKLREGKQITFGPAYLKKKSDFMACSASVAAPGFKAMQLSKYEALCYFDEAGHLVLKASGLSQASIGGKAVAVGGDKSQVTIPIEDLRAAVTFREQSLAGRAPLAVALKLTNEDGDWTGWFRFDDELIARYVRKEIAKGLLLPGEDANAPVGSTHLIVGGRMYDRQNQVIGDGKTLRDVGKIALVEEKSRKLDTCRYRDGKGKTQSVSLIAKDAQVTLFERRSGRRLASTLIRAKGSLRCKSSVSRKNMHKDTILYLPNKGAEIATWAKAELAK